MDNVRRLTFIGQISDGSVKAALYWKGDLVTLDGPLSFSLDEWLELRDASADEDNVWVTTPAEYEDLTGEAIDRV